MNVDAERWIARARAHGHTVPATSAPEEAPASAAYRAWGKGHPEARLFEVRLCPEKGQTSRGELLPLHYLMRVSYSAGPHGDAVTFSFADCLITARGRNLGGLKAEMIAGKVDFIEQFDPARWGEPLADAPVITDIEVIAPGRSKAS